MKTLRYLLLPIALYLTVQPAKADIGIPDPDCVGPIKYNPETSLISFLGDVSLKAYAGITNITSENPSGTLPPQGIPKRDSYVILGTLQNCKNLKTKNVLLSDSVLSPENNCGKANAGAGLGEFLTVNCNSSKIEVSVDDFFNFFGSGRLFASCCQGGPSVAGTIGGNGNAETADKMSGFLDFEIPSYVNSVQAIFKGKISCPLVPEGGPANYQGKFSAELFKLNAQGEFVPVTIGWAWPSDVAYELAVDSNPNSAQKDSEELKVKLKPGIYQLSITYKGKGQASKTQHCPSPPSADDTDFSLSASGSIQAKATLTVVGWN